MATTVTELSGNNGFVAVPTNILSLLTEEQRDVLSERFNNAWLKSRQNTIDTLQKDHALDFFSAAMAITIVEDSESLISNKRVSESVDSMLDDTRDVLRGQKDTVQAALHGIQTTYEKLTPGQQKTAGTRLRKKVLAGHTLKDAQVIIQRVTEYLSVRESEWL